MTCVWHHIVIFVDDDALVYYWHHNEEYVVVDVVGIVFAVLMKSNDVIALFWSSRSALEMVMDVVAVVNVVSSYCPPCKGLP